jgi:hypothetical protein
VRAASDESAGVEALQIKERRVESSKDQSSSVSSRETKLIFYREKVREREREHAHEINLKDTIHEKFKIPGHVELHDG